MRLNLRLLKDTLTVEIFTPGPEDDSGVPIGPGGSVPFLSQPCNDQDLRFRVRSQAIINGVAGALPVSVCYTAWFPWPTPPNGSSVAVRVNGHWRPLLKQGPPVDVGALGQVYQLELGAPESNR